MCFVDIKLDVTDIDEHNDSKWSDTYVKVYICAQKNSFHFRGLSKWRWYNGFPSILCIDITCKIQDLSLISYITTKPISHQRYTCCRPHRNMGGFHRDPSVPFH